MNHTAVRGLLCRALALCLIAVAAPAQTLNTGVFLGTVLDQSGAAVPEASVRVVREGTSFERATTTGPDGAFRLLEIPAGRYRIHVEKPGFQQPNEPAWS